MEVNKKQLADIFGASIRTIQNWQEQGMPVLRGGGKGNEVLRLCRRHKMVCRNLADPAREFTMIQSAPLMLLADPDEFVSVQLA